jgi:hypothetical protein
MRNVTIRSARGKAVRSCGGLGLAVGVLSALLPTAAVGQNVGHDVPARFEAEAPLTQWDFADGSVNLPADHGRASNPYKLETPPNPTSPDGSLVSGSCGSGFCAAVGSDLNESGATHALAEMEQGRGWRQTITRQPVDATRSVFEGVSCPASSACTAVGFWNDPAGDGLTLAEAWNGRAWTVQPTPDAKGSSGDQLSSVACNGASSCMAVGSSAGAGGVFALTEAWNGTKWFTLPMPLPSGASDTELLSVSCLAPADCTAVGAQFSDTTASSTPLIVAFNGSHWTVVGAPSLPAGAEAGFAGVSCSSTSRCMAVGSDDVQSGAGSRSVPLAALWNGTSWRLSKPAVPHASVQSTLNGVSCTGTSFCESVGAYAASSAPSYMVPLADYWVGSSSRVAASVSPKGSIGASFSSAYCRLPEGCVGTGSFVRKAGYALPFAEKWANEVADVEPVAYGAGVDPFTNVLAVSCVSASYCMAVGGYTNAADNDAGLSDVWNGRRWALQAVPEPPGASTFELHAVKCLSRSECVAVGGDTTPQGTSYGFAELWNGKSWEATSAVPPPPRSTASALLSLSCPSAKACMSVGNYFPSSAPGQGYAEVWNGESWKLALIALPKTAVQTATLGVACTSAEACTAVGSDSEGQDASALIETWNGSAWTVQTVPTPKGSAVNQLEKISCTTPVECTIIGAEVMTNGVPTAEALAGHGSDWRLLPAPHFAGSAGLGSGLGDISCLSSTECTAVGASYQPQGLTTAEIQTWNGQHWRVWTAPEPLGTQKSALLSVSCVISRCVSVGYSIGPADQLASVAVAGPASP